MSGQLEGRVAIVTGASRGIGTAVARAFARAGAAVVLAARSADPLAGLADEIVAMGGRALAIPTDISDPIAVRRLVERTVDAYGRLDAAVNNAAGGHRPAPLAEVAPEEFDGELAVSLSGVFLSMKYEIPAMLASGGGSIVNMASTAGLEGVAGLAGYVATKFGVVGLTRVAALEYGRSGVRVNALAPGPILTEGLERAGEQAQRHAASTLPAGRLGQPNDVAAAAVWLCSDQSSFVSGVTLPVDGGKMAGMHMFSAPQRPSAQRSER